MVGNHNLKIEGDRRNYEYEICRVRTTSVWNVE
jgi:hypothetical protein